jgi:hypothetical protein
MKNVLRSFIFMVGLILTMDMIMGCNNDSNDTELDVTAPNRNVPTGGKVVAAEYRGTYILEGTTRTLTLTEKNTFSNPSNQ